MAMGSEQPAEEAPDAGQDALEQPEDAGEQPADEAPEAAQHTHR